MECPYRRPEVAAIVSPSAPPCRNTRGRNARKRESPQRSSAIAQRPGEVAANRDPPRALGGPPGEGARTRPGWSLRQRALEVEPAIGKRSRQQLRLGSSARPASARRCQSASLQRRVAAVSNGSSRPPGRCRLKNELNDSMSARSALTGLARTGRSAATPCHDRRSDANPRRLGLAHRPAAVTGMSPALAAVHPRRCPSAQAGRHGAARGREIDRDSRAMSTTFRRGHRRVIRAHLCRRQVQGTTVERSPSVQSRDLGGAAANRRSAGCAARIDPWSGVSSNPLGHMEPRSACSSRTSIASRGTLIRSISSGGGSLAGLLDCGRCWCRRRADGRGRARW